MVNGSDRLGTQERKRRGPSDTRLLGGLVVALLVVVGMVGLAIAQWLASRPEAVQYRNHGIEVMRSERDRVPPPPGSTFAGENVYNAPLKTLALDTYYSFPPGGCSDALAYYESRLPETGWSSEYTTGTTGTRFTKSVSGYHLQLDVTCNEGDYDVAISNR